MFYGITSFMRVVAVSDILYYIDIREKVRYNNSRKTEGVCRTWALRKSTRRDLSQS